MARGMSASIILAMAFTLLMIVFFGVPLVWLVLSSLDPRASPELRLPEEVSASNYVALRESTAGVSPLRWILNSLLLSVATATITTAISLGAAYALTRHRFRFQGAIITSTVVFRLIPSIILAIPIMVVFSRLGLINSVVALTIAISSLILPFTILTLEGYLGTIPRFYEEAAMIDGLTRIGAFFRIVLPLALPGLVTVWLLSFVITWGEFVLPLFLINSVDKMPAAVGLYFFFGEYGRVDYGKLSAFSIVYSIPAIVIFMMIRKHLERGLAALATR